VSPQKTRHPIIIIFRPLAQSRKLKN